MLENPIKSAPRTCLKKIFAMMRGYVKNVSLPLYHKTRKKSNETRSKYIENSIAPRPDWV